MGNYPQVVSTGGNHGVTAATKINYSTWSLNSIESVSFPPAALSGCQDSYSAAANGWIEVSDECRQHSGRDGRHLWINEEY
jgi:hypothetical protein